jgi:AMP-binding enzyme
VEELAKVGDDRSRARKQDSRQNVGIVRLRKRGDLDRDREVGEDDTQVEQRGAAADDQFAVEWIDHSQAPAILSHRNLVANTLQCRAWIGTNVLPAAECALTPLPLYHIFSLTANMLTFASLGGLNVLIPDPRDLHRLIATMHRTKFTMMSGVNTLFNALTNAPDFASIDFRSLKFALGGGAAIQRSVATRWQEATGSPLWKGMALPKPRP